MRGLYYFSLKKTKAMTDIKHLISQGKTTQAIRLLDKHIAGNPASDEAYFLRGNAYLKQGDVREALNNYLKAMELNPDSPAHQAYRMQIDILNFYNKDMYNH